MSFGGTPMDTKEMKKWYYTRALAELKGLDIQVVDAACNPDTLWGAYIRISESSYEAFVKSYWHEHPVPEQDETSRLDPKLLLVAPGSRLSLQYHHRRNEHWRVVDGPVKAVFGPDGNHLEEKIFQVGEILRLPVESWHRLVGLDTWGLVAEIWESTNPEDPSDESDIVRVSDDFGR